MRYRIKAAWKVLRGEWVVHPIGPPYPWSIGQDAHGNYTTSGDARITYTSEGRR